MEKNNRPAIAISQYAMVAMSAMGTALILGWVLKYSFYGIDFTDESFYLVWMSNPFIYDVSATQFGFIYHPLYVALGGSIAELRQTNILITFGLGWVLVYTFLASLAPEVRERRFVLHTAAAGLATSALVILNTWLPTPNYNGLAFQSLLLTGAGLLWANKAVTARSLIGWIIIGVGGWLAFMAKPSTAVALAIGTFICLVASRKFSLWPFLLAATTAIGLLLLSAFLIDGSISGFARRLILGIDVGRRLGGGHTVDQILRIDSFRLHKSGKLAILSVLVLSSLAMRSVLSKKPGDAIGSLILSVGFFSVVVLLVLGKIHTATNLGEFEGVLIFGVVLAAFFSGLILGKFSPLKSISGAQWAVAIFFLIVPYIFAFGTNRNYWQNEPWAGIFWLLAGMTLLGPVARERATWSFILPLALATQATTAVLLHTGLERPQRQDQPLRLNDTTMEFGLQRSPLVLSAGYASYIADAEAVAQNGGFEPYTPVIDLSGRSPGLLYAIGAESTGQAWTLGGYPGSSQVAKAALDRVPCEKIAAAWVLFEPNSPGSISAEILPSLGAAFPEKYRKVGAWWTAKGASGFEIRREQELYQPIASIETLKACTNLRVGEVYK